MVKELVLGLAFFGCTNGSSMDQKGLVEKIELLDNTISKDKVIEALPDYIEDGRFSKKWENKLETIKKTFIQNADILLTESQIKDLYVWLMITKYCCCPTTMYAFKNNERKSIAKQFEEDEQLNSMAQSKSFLFRYIAQSLLLFGSYARL